MEDGGLRMENSEQRKAIYVTSYCALCAYCGKNTGIKKTISRMTKVANFFAEKLKTIINFIIYLCQV